MDEEAGAGAEVGVSVGAARRNFHVAERRGVGKGAAHLIDV